MGSEYTTNGGIEKIGLGEQAGAWGTTTNNNFDIIDRLINGVVTITLSSGGTSTLSTSNGSLSDGMFKVLQLAGSPDAGHIITIEPKEAAKLYFVKNGSGQAIIFNQGSGGTVDNSRAVSIPNNNSAIIFANGGGNSAIVTSLSASLLANSLDASDGNFKFSVSGTEILRISNSSSDVVIKPIVDEKDIIFQQRDGTEVARIEDNGTFNVVTGKLAINATAVTSTAAELNLLDGDTSVGSSITVADADGVVVNDGGTMKSVPASDFRTYIMPAGSVIPYAGTSAPTGFLFCDGSSVSRSTYAALFAVIGTEYGTPDDSSTFKLPDLRGRVVAGKDDMGGSSANRLTDQSGGLNGDTLGGTGGSETHTLTTAQLASHTHSFSGSGSTTAMTFLDDGLGVDRGGGGQGSSSNSISVSISGTTGSKGSGSAHNNVQPTVILQYIIRT